MEINNKIMTNYDSQKDSVFANDTQTETSSTPEEKTQLSDEKKEDKKQ